GRRLARPTGRSCRSGVRRAGKRRRGSGGAEPQVSAQGLRSGGLRRFLSRLIRHQHQLEGRPMRKLLLRRTAFLVVLLLATWRPRETLAADVLTFDTNGDGVPDITIPDSDGDGRFEWPAGTTKLPGTLHFSAGNDIEFSGYTTIKADAITIDQGATLSAGLNLHQIVSL